MKIFDCHTHIENRLDDFDLAEVSHRNIIFNSIESYEKHIHLVPKEDAVSLILDLENTEYIIKQCQDNKINALKIHSRIQNLNLTDYDIIIEKLKKFPDEIPVIYDAFYFGDEIEHQPSLEQVIRLAKTFPHKKFIIGHCGGYKVLEYFFHLRQLPNIYYDLSFSLQYLEDSSHYLDLKKLIKYTDKRKLMYGSDYHWASPKLQYNILQRIFDELQLTYNEQKLILFDNAFSIFNPKKY